MEFGLLSGGNYYSPKAAYNEDFSKYSPGHLLVRNVIKDLTMRGAKMYDFLGPRSRYKCLWAPEFREHANCYIFRPTFKGRLLYQLTMKLAPIVRRAKYRVKGDPQAVSIS